MALTGYEKALEQYTKSELIEIAKTYTIYYQTPSGIGQISGYNKLTKQELINLIKKDKDYQKAKPKSRVELLKSRIKNVRDPEMIMKIISEIFTDVDIIPQPGKFYTFVYNAKTPRLRYDQHPLIACEEIKGYGFTGINFHWRKPRQYTWNEIGGTGKFHKVYFEELDEMLSIPYAKYLTVPG